MNINYRYVQVYVDKNDNLLVIPTGKSKKIKNAIICIDIVNQLLIPYTDEELENILRLAFSQCYSKEPDDTTNVSSLERYLNIRGYSKAVKNRKLILCEWDSDDGYYITPTKKIPQKGFVHQKDKIIKLGKVIEDGKLAKAFKEAVDLSVTY